MSKFCSNCGTKLNDNQAVCLNCGVSVQNNIKQEDTKNNSSDKSANTGFILGLVSIIAWFIPLFGYPVTICGIIFSSKGLKSTTKKTKAIVGLVLSIIFLIITLMNSILGVILQLNSL